MQTVRLHDRSFSQYLSEEEITNRVEAISVQIYKDYTDLQPHFLVMLNGAFMFASELYRRYGGDAEISFVKAKSYQGLKSTGKVEFDPVDSELVKGKDILLIEDIVDSGNTLSNFIPLLKQHQPKSIRIASLLFKPASLKHDVKVDYCGFEIPNDFVVGYGLDYDGLGRNLPAIYSLAE